MCSVVNRQPAEGSAPHLVDISPSELVGLTLPVYKAMSPMAGAMEMSKAERIAMMTTPNHYTSVSFVRLLALAGRRLRLTAAHFRAVLNAMMDDSGMIMASNLCQEQVQNLDILDFDPGTPVSAMSSFHIRVKPRGRHA